MKSIVFLFLSSSCAVTSESWNKCKDVCEPDVLYSVSMYVGKESCGCVDPVTNRKTTIMTPSDDQ